MVSMKDHIKRIREISDTVETEAIQVLLEAGELVRQDAMASIREGTIRGPQHVPSLPGQPPKGDTGNLELNIDVELRRSEKTVNVISRAVYSAALEFGTSKMAARPFLRPALLRNKNRLVTGMAAAGTGDASRVFKNGRIE